MANETAAILEIMRAVGVLDFVMGKAKDQAEVVGMFRDDFQSLLVQCIN
jgi:hypothetical protein